MDKTKGLFVFEVQDLSPGLKSLFLDVFRGLDITYFCAKTFVDKAAALMFQRRFSDNAVNRRHSKKRVSQKCARKLSTVKSMELSLEAEGRPFVQKYLRLEQ